MEIKKCGIDDAEKRAASYPPILPAPIARFCPEFRCPA